MPRATAGTVAADPEQPVVIYTLGGAARAARRHKSTISRDIKHGRLSATRNADGSFAIDAAELARVYPRATVAGNGQRNDQQPPPATVATEALAAAEARLEERERERDQLLETIRDLRARLDQEAEERRRLTLMITGERPEPGPQRSWWARLWRR